MGPTMAGQFPDGSREVVQFDLRTAIPAGAAPGTNGYVPVKRGAYKYVSWWSAWPLNPDITKAALLEFQSGMEIPLTECQFNWPMGSTEFLRLVNPGPQIGNMPQSGTYLLTLCMHNEPMTPIVLSQPFIWSLSFSLPAGSIGSPTWGPAGTPAADQTFWVTGYAPFSKLRIKNRVTIANIDYMLRWQPLACDDVAHVLTSVHNPPAAQSADLRITNMAVGATTIDVLLEFSNVV